MSPNDNIADTNKASHRRHEEREHIDLDGPTLRVENGATEMIKLHDLSSQGFRTDWPHKLVSGDPVWLKLPGMDALSAKVAWELDLMIGCKFDVALRPAVYSRIINRNR